MMARYSVCYFGDIPVKLATYLSDSGARSALVVDDHLIDLNETNDSLPKSVKSLLAGGESMLQVAAECATSGNKIPLDSVELLSPITNPEKVICIGLNYADHAKESGVEPPELPVVFNKFPSCVIGPNSPIVLPKLSDQIDYEAELVVVIGKSGRYIKEEDALSHVAGYTVGHDVSARDWQLNKPGKQWLLGKSFQTFAPIGPYLVTPSEAGNPEDLAIKLRLNGETMQDSSTKQLIFKIPYLISYLSDIIELSPGDLIFTGTPPGVGMARKPPVFLQPGDSVEVEIENLGVLTNPVVSE